ncbi:MAG: deoxyribose-phosphate aldolase [Verrucomicrobia subdivision 3 bacterium]|nr:deoxyribose-phosphate aldolase [Limisphaerales bacterium]
MKEAIDKLPAPKELARFLDWTLLRLDATKDELERACADAREHGIGCVCVNGSRVSQAYHWLGDSSVKVIAAVGYPWGAADADAKRYETEVAVDHDAHFIEVVANFGRIKDGDRDYVLRELRDIVDAADERPVSVVVEASLLSKTDVRTLCKLAVESGAKGVVTSADPAGPPPRVDDVKWLREIVGQHFGVKAAGVSDAVTALALMQAGATRIGTAEAMKFCSD